MPFLPAADVPKQSERSFMQQVLQAARLFGWRTWHDSATNAPRRCHACGAAQPVPRNVPGWPDLILLRSPRLVVAELKTERGRISPEQGVMLDAWRGIPGARVFVWRPSSWPEVEATLRSGCRLGSDGRAKADDLREI